LTYSKNQNDGLKPEKYFNEDGEIGYSEVLVLTAYC